MTAYDSFENIFAALAVIEHYPDIREPLSPGDMPSKYWKKAMLRIEELINYNPLMFVKTMELLPPDRKARFHENFQNVCADMDHERLFEAGSQPGFHTRRGEKITMRLCAGQGVARSRRGLFSNG